MQHVSAEIAQLVEHATENRGVASSILALGILGQTRGRHAGVVQLVERLLAKEKVVGSNPIARSRTQNRRRFFNLRFVSGDVAKW